MRYMEIFKRDDPFAPRMPTADVHLDITEVFANARAVLSADRPSTEVDAGQRCVAIVTPDRTLALLAGPRPGTAPKEFVISAKGLIPSTRPLNIVAVAFSGLGIPKGGDIKRIPFLAMTFSFAYIGHSVVVFEGHESGFEPALRGADALLIDSGMLPFLQKNWFEVAQGVFRANGRVRIFDRTTTDILPVVKARTADGWSYATEPDGEVSYVNCLLTTLGKRSPVPVQLCVGEPLPNLTRLAASPTEIEWTTGLPFDYDVLSVEDVIRIIRNSPEVKWSPAQEERVAGTVKMKLAESGGVARLVTFQLVLANDGSRTRSLTVERLV
jgi:hypothetical protein